MVAPVVAVTLKNSPMRIDSESKASGADEPQGRAKNHVSTDGGLQLPRTVLR